jgi:hypothetical protein
MAPTLLRRYAAAGGGDVAEDRLVRSNAATLDQAARSAASD